MGPRSRVLQAFCVAAAIAGCSVGAARAADDPAPEPRLALVIGESAYRADPLPTAANDAGLVAEALAQDGFSVTAQADANADALRKTVGAFADQIRDTGGRPRIFVYLAGHGVQYGGTNYIVPPDAHIERQSELPGKAVALRDLINAIESLPAGPRVFVFDLAHPSTIAKGEPIPLAAGLRHMQPTPGSVYAFNAAPGMVGRPDVPFYGIYARALAEALRAPGVNVQALFSQVRLRVADVSGGAVVPWDNGALEQDAPLTPADGKVVSAPVVPRTMEGLPAATVYWAAIAEDSLAGYQAFLRAFPTDFLSARVRAMEAVRLEAATWAEACRIDTPTAYWTYMLRYPRGPHYVDVRRRLAAIHAMLEPPMRFDPSDLSGLPVPTAEELRLAAQASPTFEDAAWAPPTAPPDDLLAPPPPEIYAELAPPPLVPTGALPIPAPLPGPASAGAIGRIRQAPLPMAGTLSIDANRLGGGAIAVDATTDDGLLTRAKTRLDTGLRTIVQTDTAAEVVSWTTVGKVEGDLTISQTGPVGEMLSKQVRHPTPDGNVSTVLTNGAGKLVADVTTNARGRILSVALGTAGLADPTFALEPRAPNGMRPATPPVSPTTAKPPTRVAPSAAPPVPARPPAAAPNAVPGPVPPSGPSSTNGTLELRRNTLDPPPRDRPQTPPVSMQGRPSRLSSGEPTDASPAQQQSPSIGKKTPSDPLPTGHP